GVILVLTRISRSRVYFLATAMAVALIAADASWKSKSMSDWTEDDARQILTDSPWARTARATIGALQTEDQRREGGNMGLPHVPASPALILSLQSANGRSRGPGPR